MNMLPIELTDLEEATIDLHFQSSVYNMRLKDIAAIELIRGSSYMRIIMHGGRRIFANRACLKDLDKAIRKHGEGVRIFYCSSKELI